MEGASEIGPSPDFHFLCFGGDFPPVGGTFAGYLTPSLAENDAHSSLNTPENDHTFRSVAVPKIGKLKIPRRELWCVEGCSGHFTQPDDIVVFLQLNLSFLTGDLPYCCYVTRTASHMCVVLSRGNSYVGLRRIVPVGAISSEAPVRKIPKSSITSDGGQASVFPTSPLLSMVLFPITEMFKLIG